MLLNWCVQNLQCATCHQQASGFEGLHAHGFNDEDIWDIGAVAAFYAMSNRMANLVDLRPNPEFYAMGRGERKPK